MCPIQLLTLGCGKFRIYDQDFGTLPGTQLPRLLDMGQCNDAYSALVVATVRGLPGFTQRPPETLLPAQT